MLLPRNIKKGVGIAGGIPAKHPGFTTRATSPWLRGSPQESIPGNIGSHEAKEINVEGSHVQEFAACVFLFAATVAFSRWSVRKVRDRGTSRCNKDNPADTTRSLSIGCDLETGADGAIEEPGSDTGCEGSDVKSGEASVATVDAWCNEKDGDHIGSRKESSEGSGSVLTMSPSSAGGISVLDSQRTEPYDGGASVSNSDDSICSAWTAYETHLCLDNDHTCGSTPGSRAASEVMEAGSLAPENSTSWSCDIEDRALFVRTLSSTMSDRSLLLHLYPLAEFTIDTDIGRNSSILGNMDGGSAGSDGTISGVGGGSIYDGGGIDDPSSGVSDGVLMAALDRPGALTDGREGAREWMEPHGDLEQESQPSHHPDEPGASTATDSDKPEASIESDEDPPSISVEGDEFVDESSEGGNATDDDEETSEAGWGTAGELSKFSLGSLSEVGSLFDMDAPEVARWRTEDLVDVLRGGPTVEACLRDIHLARHCDLDLSAGDVNADLTREEVIGDGRQGRVSRVRHEASGATLALKELTEDADEDDRKAAYNEICVFLRLGRHPNILKMLACNSALPTMPVLMELGMCDMADVIVSSTISMRHKIGILHDAACGLKHLHDKGTVHRDVKPGNFIVTVDEHTGRPTGKLADFGLACAAGETTEWRTGTSGYIPVELLWDPAEAGTESDVFSFAVLMLEVLVLPELRESNMFAHSTLLTEEEEAGFDSLDEDDEEGHLDAECEVVQRTLDDGSFSKEILQGSNLRPSVSFREEVCGWLKACICQPRDRRPSMTTMVEVTRCVKEGKEPPPVTMLDRV